MLYLRQLVLRGCQQPDKHLYFNKTVRRTPAGLARTLSFNKTHAHTFSKTATTCRGMVEDAFIMSPKRQLLKRYVAGASAGKSCGGNLKPAHRRIDTCDPVAVTQRATSELWFLLHYRRIALSEHGDSGARARPVSTDPVDMTTFPKIAWKKCYDSALTGQSFFQQLAGTCGLGNRTRHWVKQSKSHGRIPFAFL